MWIRRLVLFVLVAAGTAGAILWWLHDGDLAEAMAPVLQDPPPPPGGEP